MGMGRGMLVGWLRGFALALLLGAALVACGGDDDDTSDNMDTRPEPTEMGAILAASPAIGTPARSGLTQDLESDRAAIRDGNLDPDRFQAQVGLPFVLTIEGDGQPHTLVIQDLVAETQIAAEGETQVQLNVPEGSEGDKPILLDGEEAGTLEVQGAGGVPETGT